MPITIPQWIPPSGEPLNWNLFNMYTRAVQGRALTFDEGDENKNNAIAAINWLGQQLTELINNGTGGGGDWLTGDTLITYQQNTRTGWILLDDKTLGNASSNSDYTGDDYKNLFTLLWDYATDSDLLTSAGNSTTKGISADADWDANKRLILPDSRGRTIVGAGQGVGLTNRTIMSVFGAESVNLSHTHSVSLTTASALGSYTPTGTVVVASSTTLGAEIFTGTTASALTSYTPTGTVSVNASTTLGAEVFTGTTASALGNYTPTGTVVVALSTTLGAEIFTGTTDSALTSYTPTGTVSVNASTTLGAEIFTGTTDSALTSYTPTGTVSVNASTTLGAEVFTGTTASALGSYTPTGTVSVNLTNGPLTVLNNIPINFSLTGCSIAVGAGEEGINVANCNGSAVIDALDLSMALGTNVIVSSATFSGDVENLAHSHTFSTNSQNLNHSHTATFTGTPENLAHMHTFSTTPKSLNHTHIATFTGTPENLAHMHTFSTTPKSLNHTHIATFTGTPENLVHTHTFSSAAKNLNHTHTATFTGTPENLAHMHTFSTTPKSLNHTHIATFTGDLEALAHTHGVSGDTGSALSTTSVMQPSRAYYIYIKL